MTKNNLKIMLLVLPLASCGNDHIGYINSNKLLEGYHGVIPRQQSLTVQTKMLEANLDSLYRELGALPSAQRATKEQEFLRYKESVQHKVQQEDAKLQQEVLAEVNAFIKLYGQKHKYKLIFGATTQGNIVYAAEGTDLTDAILIELNKEYDQHHAGNSSK